MKCPVCHTGIGAPAVYCFDCGTFLELSPDGALPPLPAPPNLCSICHHGNAPLSRFCTRCGMPLSTPEGSAPLEPAAPLEEERRMVTVLHADLCGFTRLAECLTPEQTRGLMGALFNVVTREIVAAGGVVDAYIGDAVLAVFGVPLAYGDDPRRAAEAALAMHQAVDRFVHPILPARPVRLQLRIGIDTGQVIVGRIGALRRTTVTGATVASAMDLERAAPAGGTLLGEATRRLLPGRFLLSSQVVSSGRMAWQLHGLREEAPSAGSVAGNEPAVVTPIAGEVKGEGAWGIRPAPGAGSGGQDLALEPAGASEGLTGDERGLIQARIDRLLPEEKRLLKAAAVAGVTFWQELLERMGLPETARGLNALEERGLIRSCPRPSIQGTTEYRFVSEQVRDVAYENNLIKVRRFFHRVVAAWLEERLEGGIEHTSLLAWHHATGGEPLAAAALLVMAAESAAVETPVESITFYYEALAHLEATAVEGPEAARLKERCREVIGALTWPAGEEA